MPARRSLGERVFFLYLQGGYSLDVTFQIVTIPPGVRLDKN
jgi:hypothetical protein